NDRRLSAQGDGSGGDAKEVGSTAKLGSIKRPSTAAYSPGYRNICQFRSLAHASQQQSTSAHLSAPDEFQRELQPISKNGEERIYIFCSRDAAQEYDFAL